MADQALDSVATVAADRLVDRLGTGHLRGRQRRERLAQILDVDQEASLAARHPLRSDRRVEDRAAQQLIRHHAVIVPLPWTKRAERNRREGHI